MRNLLTAAFVLFAVVPLCLYIGVEFVPGVRRAGGGNSLTDEFLFNSYLTLLGFLFTSAAVGPLVAQFLNWQSNREWKDARINVSARLAAALTSVISDYRIFLRSVAADEDKHLTSMSMGQIILDLSDFFDIYESEQVVFNAAMHSAASNIRRQLLPFKRSLETTKSLVDRKRSFRIYMKYDSLSTLRAILQIPPPTAVSLLASDPYYSEYGELFLDGRIDRQIGAGVIPIYHFAEIDLPSIQREWNKFAKACPGGSDSQAKFEQQLEFDADTQSRLHAKYVRATIDEQHLARLVVKEGIG